MMDQQQLPQGFSMALSQRPEAMERFAALPAAERQAVIDAARAAGSKAEMRACVDRLTQSANVSILKPLRSLKRRSLVLLRAIGGCFF